MVGSDAAVMFINGYIGHADDYNLTAHSPCTQVLGVKRGVCLDVQVGGTDNNQIQEHKREDGVTTVTYRRDLQPTSDHGDKAIKEDGPTSIVWAIGRLAGKGRNLVSPQMIVETIP